MPGVSLRFRNFPRVRWMIVAALATGGRLLSEGESTSPAAGPVVTLPTYTVSEPRLLPEPEAWRYGQVPGFEILSDDSVGDTKRLIHDFLLFQRAVGAVWPEVKRNFDLPVSLILCQRAKQFADFMPADAGAKPSATFSLSLRERELAAIVLNLEVANSPIAAGELADDGAGLAESVADYSSHLLRGEYVHFLLDRIDPPPPPWLEAGLGQMLLRMTYDGDMIGIPAIADTGDLAWRRAFAAKAKAAGAEVPPPPAVLSGEKNFRTALAAGAIMPLDRMFRETSDVSLTGVSDTAWGRQCYQFVHLCLFGQKMHLQKALLDFSIRASLQPPDENLFRRCFGMSYQEMLLTLWAYTDFYSGVAFSIHPRKEPKPAEPAALVLRAASDSEVGRIKGDALRMAGRIEAAHFTLIASYLRGGRDPQLLAALGLEEIAAGRRDRAEKFLQAAVAAHTRRARAYLELARLRYAAATAGPKTSSPKLGVEQLTAILAPLWQARSHPPPLPEIYLLFAKTWSHAAFRPARANLAVVDEGVTTFPFDADLLYEDARLRAQYAYYADAAALADLGLKFSRGDSDRARLEKLKASLPSPSH